MDREQEIDRIVRHALPAVGVRTRADERAVRVAAKLASGAAEALDLGPGPSRRLATVTVEGTRNVVQHAYEDLPVGDVEIELALRSGPTAAGNGGFGGRSSGRGEVLVSIRDFGNGCAMSPTPAEPPGLGLSIMSELSECLTISARKRRGTVVDATIRLAGPEDEEAGRGGAVRGSRIDITDPVFLAPVIPRAVAVHASGAGTTIDAMRAAIAGGRRIAESIDEDAIARAGASASLAIDRPHGSDALEVRMGPMPAHAADALSKRLAHTLEPPQHATVEPTGERAGVLVALPLR